MEENIFLIKIWRKYLAGVYGKNYLKLGFHYFSAKKILSHLQELSYLLGLTPGEDEVGQLKSTSGRGGFRAHFFCWITGIPLH